MQRKNKYDGLPVIITTRLLARLADCDEHTVTAARRRGLIQPCAVMPGGSPVFNSAAVRKLRTYLDDAVAKGRVGRPAGSRRGTR